MVEVLMDTNQMLTLDEIVDLILAQNPAVLTGKTPKKSLYSVIYRREKSRKERGISPLFKINIRGGITCYSLNPKGVETIADRVLKK